MKNGCVSGYHIFYMNCVVERDVCGIWKYWGREGSWNYSIPEEFQFFPQVWRQGIPSVETLLLKSDFFRFATRIMFSMSIDKSNEGIIFNVSSRVSCILSYWCHIIWRCLICLRYKYSGFSVTAVQPVMCLLCRRVEVHLSHSSAAEILLESVSKSQSTWPVSVHLFRSRNDIWECSYWMYVNDVFKKAGCSTEAEMWAWMMGK